MFRLTFFNSHYYKPYQGVVMNLSDERIVDIQDLFIELDRLRIILAGVPMLLPFGTTGVTYSGLLRGAVWLKEALRRLGSEAEIPALKIGSIANLPADARIAEVEQSIKERVLPRIEVLMKGASTDRFYSLAITQAYVCFTETCAFLLEEVRRNSEVKKRWIDRSVYFEDRNPMRNDTVKITRDVSDFSQNITEDLLLAFAKVKLMLPKDYEYTVNEDFTFEEYFDSVTARVKVLKTEQYLLFLDEVREQYFNSNKTIIEMMPGHTVK